MKRQPFHQARYNITGGCNTDRNIIVVTIFHAEIGDLEAKEFKQHKADALRVAEWFRSYQVELVIIENTTNCHMLYYDTLREEGINIAVVDPIVVKVLLRVEQQQACPLKTFKRLGVFQVNYCCNCGYQTTTSCILVGVNERYMEVYAKGCAFSRVLK